MSITDELRKYADELDTAASMMSEHGFSPVAMKLTAIADRIDAEHERKVGCTADEWDYWESTHIELPKDADGEPIHIGDAMDSPHYEDGTVIGIQFCEGGRELIAVKPHDWDTPTWRDPECYRHHHAPTVEDVLLEALSKATFETEAGCKNLVNEYAPKVREVLGVDDGE